MAIAPEERKIPRHLKKFMVEQQYDKYTPINHAVWRYVMRQNHNFLKNTAHEAYLDGLSASGISIERIPNVDEMNEALAPQGWGAVNIDGFIPGVVFFDFQAHGLLPIASEIRKLENIQYTPAPDIIHEAAGHAPILLDKKFSEYVKLFGSIGSKAIATKEEHELFDAIRTYSNLLESGVATDEEINSAKVNFEEKQKAVTKISEAEQISRLYWWTVEYGLIGTVDEPKIYGAGLLSSVSEGRSSITDNVVRLPFELENVINTSFDITKPQPQLFVCENFEQLINEVNKFAETMAFKRGGTESLEKALDSNHTATIVYSSGLQVTGTLSQIRKDENGEAIYIHTNSPTSLAANNKQLKGHGKETHHHGFSSPIGYLKGFDIPLEEFTEEQLAKAGILTDTDTELVFESGIKVKGTPTEIIRHQDKIVLISLENCTVVHNEEILFQSEWGAFDMAVGATVTSVFAGAADSEEFYADLEEVEQYPFEETELSDLEKLYGRVREIRESKSTSTEQLKEVIVELKNHPKDWLLRVEIVEILSKKETLNDELILLEKELQQLQLLDSEHYVLIERGLQLAHV